MLTNQQRNQAGLPPLKHEPLLRQTAEGHSQRMAVGNFFMHCDPDTGKLPWDRMRDVGYNWTMAGENIAVGYQTPDAVMNAWMSSPPHAAAILSPDFLEIGVGYYYQADDQPNLRYSTTNSCTPNTTVPGPYYHYWTQDFGRRWNVWPLIIAGEAFTTPSLRVELYLYRPTSPSQMRLSNDGIQWSDWRPFTETLRWQLNPGNGEKVVHAQVYNGASTYSVSDTIHLDAPAPVTAAVEISAAANVTLTWQHAAVNLWYDVYGSNRPYFTPGDPDAVLLGPAVEPANGETKVIFTDTTGAANEVRFYVVRAVAGDGETTADSNRTGRFPFPLLPGD